LSTGGRPPQATFPAFHRNEAYRQSQRHAGRI